MTPEQFALSTFTLAKGVEAAVTQLQKKVATDVAKAVIEATPVDTGRAVSNWQGAIGTPETSPVEARQKGTKGSTANINKALALDQITSVFNRHNSDKDLYITNTAPYISSLNNGSSTQAPRLFVESSIDSVTRNIPGLKIKGLEKLG